MTEIRRDENAIILASIQKMISLGTTAAQRLLDGKESRRQIDEGLKIVRLLNAYNAKADLTDAEIDAVLYCLKYTSGTSYFPTTSPIVGQPLVITITQSPIPAGVWVEQGNWDGSTNLFPTVGKLGDTVKQGYTWENIAATTSLLGPDGFPIPAGVTIVAKVDSPGQSLNNWRIFYG